MRMMELMDTKQRESLLAEAATIEDLLKRLSDDRVIERLGLEQRLEEARTELEALDAAPLGKLLPITFRGKPVEGMHSIDAGFASAALRAFVEATDTVAASFTDDLKGRGRLPSVSRSLRIIDTARGSFGFELELPPPELQQDQLAIDFNEADPYERAIETTFALIADAAASDEEGMSDLIAEIHPRAAAKVHAFAKVLSDHDAGFAAEFEGKQVQLRESSDVQRVLDALKDEDMGEREERIEGVLLGILPESRRFECRLDDGRLLTGKVDRVVADIGELKTHWENKPASLQFRIVSVRANERFILTGATALAGNP
jgi:hypothetical protein